MCRYYHCGDPLWVSGGGGGGGGEGRGGWIRETHVETLCSVHIPACMYVCVHANVYMYISMCVHMRMHTYTPMQICVCMQSVVFVCRVQSSRSNSTPCS